MMADEECNCRTIPCFCAEIDRHVEQLLTDPRCRNPSTYRYPDRDYPWQLINALRRRVLATAKTERKRCAEYVRMQGTIDNDSRLCDALADELERLPES